MSARRSARAARSGRRRWWTVPVRVLTSLLLAVVVLVGTASILVPRLTGAVPLTVLSDSMSPGMPVGSLAVVRPTMATSTSPAAMSPAQIDAVNDVAGIEPGDVIVFAPEAGDDTLVIHRVRTVSEHSGTRVFTTQGDNNGAPDDPVAGHQVRAVLWYSLPWLGYVNDGVDDGARRVIGLTAAGAGYAWALTVVVRGLTRRGRPPRGDAAPA